MTYTIRLTPLQHKALMSVLVNYAHSQDATREWLSAVDETKVTLADLMTLVVKTVPDRETALPGRIH